MLVGVDISLLGGGVQLMQRLGGKAAAVVADGDVQVAALPGEGGALDADFQGGILALGVFEGVLHKGEQAQRRHQQVGSLRVQKQVQLGRVLRPGPLDAHVAFHPGQLRLQGDQLAVVLKDAAQVGGEVQHQILDGTVLFLLCQGVHQVQAV